ncbi:hypothetical protein Catovirus_1_982 [Catovirus CTV1]|uniref:Uncharacterized protein n=1 Tax=Catovirus CTV1 TaxID=1977631 RepID=A0A1V0SB54_9VIRU|nr:hypothetical protein Catovirus_1_982 [Catovirus CTV1]
MKNFEDIIKKGKYYYPANSHYMNDTKVICDRCFKNDITSSIGYDQLDLCLQCAEIVSNQMKNRELFVQSTKQKQKLETLTFMERSLFNPEVSHRPLMTGGQVLTKTNMEQAMFKPKTYMEQGMFRPKTKMMQDMYNY